jgi:hypothetical protein
MAPPEIKRKEKLIVDSTNCTPTWMVTMGDAMSLLLCFFVLMLNFGSLHSDELINVFGVLRGGNEIMKVESTGKTTPRSGSKVEDEFAPVVLRNTRVPLHLRDLKRKLAAEGYTHNVTIEELESGIRFRIRESLLFTDDGKVSSSGEDLLHDIANLLQATPNEVRLYGPGGIGDAAAAGAYAKSLAIAEFFVGRGHLARERFGIGAKLFSAVPTDATFDIQLREKAGSKELTFADLWDQEEWRQ